MAPLSLTGGYQRIGKGIYLSSSGNVTPNRGSRPPTLILTFGWSVFCRAIISEYPADVADYRESTCVSNLEPVIHVLENLGYLPSSMLKTKATDKPEIDPPRILIHAFSNGGCSQLTCLSRLLKARFSNWDILTPGICAFVLDSCPGLGTMQHVKNSITPLVRNPVLRTLFRGLIVWLFYYSAIMKRLFNSENLFEILKQDLNRPNLLPWTRKSTPRLYLCSKADTMVAFHEVEDHMKNAKAAGFKDVRFEVFVNTPHVNHAKFEPERYWGAVKAVWDAACQQEQTND
ncbi:Transmembrane protein 53 [Termitomyces sp. J132]|nr:Transmembrane protein 53 [Termitomyces sp. J132]